MKNNITFILLLCIIIIDKLSFNIVDKCIYNFNQYVPDVCVDFILTKVLRQK